MVYFNKKTTNLDRIKPEAAFCTEFGYLAVCNGTIISSSGHAEEQVLSKQDHFCLPCSLLCILLPHRNLFIFSVWSSSNWARSACAIWLYNQPLGTRPSLEQKYLLTQTEEEVTHAQRWMWRWKEQREIDSVKHPVARHFSITATRCICRHGYAERLGRAHWDQLRQF